MKGQHQGAGGEEGDGALPQGGKDHGDTVHQGEQGGKQGQGVPVGGQVGQLDQALLEHVQAQQDAPCEQGQTAQQQDVGGQEAVQHRQHAAVQQGKKQEHRREHPGSGAFSLQGLQPQAVFLRQLGRRGVGGRGRFRPGLPFPEGVKPRALLGRRLGLARGDGLPAGGGLGTGGGSLSGGLGTLGRLACLAWGRRTLHGRLFRRSVPFGGSRLVLGLLGGCLGVRGEGDELRPVVLGHSHLCLILGGRRGLLRGGGLWSGGRLFSFWRRVRGRRRFAGGLGRRGCGCRGGGLLLGRVLLGGLGRRCFLRWGLIGRQRLVGG